MTKTIRTASYGVIRINVKDESKTGLALITDVHFDSKHCRKDLLKKDLDKAKELGYMVFLGGDTFDAMQGTKDPRRNMDDLDPKYLGQKYFDLVLDDAINFFEPYKDILTVVSYGNHETSALKHYHRDVVYDFVREMNRIKSHVVLGGYQGWVRLAYGRNNDKAPVRANVRMYYHHGYGGTDSPVTRGVIQTNRQQVYLEGADIVWNGHNHQAYIVPIKAVGITNKDTPYERVAWHIRTSGYKMEFGKQGWADVTGKAPTLAGCAFVPLDFANSELSTTINPYLLVR